MLFSLLYGPVNWRFTEVTFFANNYDNFFLEMTQLIFQSVLRK